MRMCYCGRCVGCLVIRAERAEQEVYRLKEEGASRETCGREDRCEWKKTSIVKEARLQEQVDTLRGAIAGWREENARLGLEVDIARKEVEMLRALCAARPERLEIWCKSALITWAEWDALRDWIRLLDAAGRGEGEK